MAKSMVAYAARTGTRANLDALKTAGWRLMVSARGVLRSEGFRYALDNGAWTAYQRGEAFDERAFLVAVDKLGADADWIVIPDIVAGGLDSLRFSLSWLSRLQDVGVPLLLAVQNGIEPREVGGLVSPGLGIFVGGDTAWKEGTMSVWGDLAVERGCHLHIGRVNTVRRIRLCSDAGADSFDGSSASRFAVSIGTLTRARETAALQRCLWGAA